MERVKPNGCKSEVYVRGLGGLQIDIAMLCEQDESRGATFSVADLRTQVAEIRSQRPDKTFKLSFSRAVAGLVRRGHVCWVGNDRQRVKRGPVEPKLPRLTKEEERELLEFFRMDMARPPDDHDYLADGPKAVNPVHELQRIATHSRDFGARLAAIRRLAQMLGDRPFAPPSTEAKWNVVLVPPGEPGHRDYKAEVDPRHGAHLVLP